MLTRLNIDGFTIYTNAKSSCCTPETNAKLDVNYISKKTFFKAMSPVEQQRAQERRQVVWGQGPRTVPAVGAHGLSLIDP